MTDNGDTCPICKKAQLPKIQNESKATARRCQNCGFTEELGFTEKHDTPAHPLLPVTAKVE